MDPSASVVVVTISMARGMEATTSTTVKDRASTTEVMCARCRYTTEHSVRETTTRAIMMSISMAWRFDGSVSPCTEQREETIIRYLTMRKGVGE